MDIRFVKDSASNGPPRLSEPFLIGYMSVDMAREYLSDLSQLKFLTAIPKGRLSWDLNHNINKAVKRTTDDNDEKISLMLKFLLDQSARINFFKGTCLTFITYRRTLISVMCLAFINSKPLRIVASLHNNCIYLCSLETPQDVLKRKSRNKQDDKFCAWGYKFEQYVLSDLPGLQPDIQKPVVENEEFSMYYYSEFGNHKLFYGAQIDGLVATSGMVQDPPEANDVEINLTYLRKNQFVELKTNREIQHRRQEQNFKRYKLFRCWCQCYLAGLKGLLVGFRNNEGIIQRLQWFATEEIATYCKNEWNPRVALNYLDYFLSFVKNAFNDSRRNFATTNSVPITLQFDLDVDKTIKVRQCSSQDVVILPDWYLYKS